MPLLHQQLDRRAEITRPWQTYVPHPRTHPQQLSHAARFASSKIIPDNVSPTTRIAGTTGRDTSQSERLYLPKTASLRIPREASDREECGRAGRQRSGGRSGYKSGLTGTGTAFYPEAKKGRQGITEGEWARMGMESKDGEGEDEISVMIAIML